MASFTVPDLTTLVDGTAVPYNTYVPGDEFLLQNTRSLACKFQNINGTAANPCYIRPTGGQVVMVDPPAYTYDSAMLLENCDYMEVDGTAVSGVYYGFDLQGYRGFTAWGCKNVTVHHIECHDCGIQTLYIATQDGFLGHTRAAWTMGDCEIYDVYVHESGVASSSSGLYLGRTQFADPKFDELIVHNNDIESTTTEGIQIRCSTLTYVMNNRLWRTAVDNLAGDRNGLYLDRESGECYVYSNWIAEPGWSGIGCYEDESGAEKHIYNNVVRDAGYYATAGYGVWWSPVLVTDDPDGYIHHNTIVDTKTDGFFSTNGAGTLELFDNIIVGSGSSDVNNGEPAAFIDNNQTGAVADQYFRNAAIYDYQLTTSSPALDDSSARDDPAYDFDGVERPQGDAADVGAYEMPYVIPGTPGGRFRIGRRQTA